ncbi:MAG: ergothioneine biosynthesis protein EgtC [Candidatus Marinimicrobia bacterium]|nr:ergothioneine biosynthesis protein EgtC [Candidatus Neomarinimicrobiota bacterium]MCF7827601.1 ergothioneine biosynthesis protein EgtC [Candidatus Neomarinimicrobiota bacterium]MCF7881538.1 ergothioneine biosynthesis protein EgtC [Candidatus Neomarinimicrobiota bacterium]
MCRHLAYMGKPIPLDSLIYEPPRSLEVQSYDPQELLSGNVNVDGFGCGWYNRDISEEPGVYTSMRNLWADSSFRSISKIIRPGLLLASVRNATPPSPVDEQSVQPFARGRYLFMHNGQITGYHKKVKRSLHAELPDDLYSTLYSHSDSATIFALLYNELRQCEPSQGSMIEGLQNIIHTITAYAAEAGSECQLNLALSDGESIIMSRYSNTEDSNSLYCLKDGENFPESVLIASEALDDDADWEKVPHNHLISVNSQNEITLQPLTTGE